MKKLLYIFSIGYFVFALHSCDEFLDVNNDPTRIGEENVSMRVLLPTVIEASGAAYQSAGLQAQQVTHHLDNIQTSYYQRFTSSGAWSEIYLKSLNNINTIKEISIEQNSPHYAGVVEVLRALNLGLLTDTWENAPVTQAGQKSENISPEFNTQAEIYDLIFEALDEGITLLSASESDFSPGNDDLLYGGDLSKWIKAANALKVRFALHVKNKGMFSNTQILEMIPNAFTSNDDDFELIYAENYTSPWYNSIARLIDQTIFTQTFGDYYVDLLNGNYNGEFDPRTTLIMDTLSGSEGEFKGLASYIDDTDYTVVPNSDTYYMNPLGPNVLMSFAELKFIESEIALENGDMERAQAAYVEGIRSHMGKVGVATSAIDNYIANLDNIQPFSLANLMKEKMVALVFNYEAWNDMRRYNFDEDVFIGFSEPDFNGRSVPAYRAEYPDSERTRNSANAEQNYKDFTEIMWKDQN